MMRSVAFLILVSLVCTPFALADGPPKEKTYVKVEAGGDDPVGRSLTYQVREGLRKSSAFELVMREEDSTMQIRIATLDPDMGKGNFTVYSVVWTGSFPGAPWSGLRHFLRQTIGGCGLHRVEGAAAEILAETDNLEAEILKGEANYMNKIKTESKGNVLDFLGVPIPKDAVPPAGK
jgi:hypothetical protein